MSKQHSNDSAIAKLFKFLGFVGIIIGTVLYIVFLSWKDHNSSTNGAQDWFYWVIALLQPFTILCFLSDKTIAIGNRIVAANFALVFILFSQTTATVDVCRQAESDSETCKYYREGLAGALFYFGGQTLVMLGA
eukprot:GILJ01000396.1.p2 GENE.GILJ01000396.1~~GILJ01000396.1.p2  ORF type:complete len:134 (+),score=25.53 GILJ01000396.1:54-455(+)